MKLGLFFVVLIIFSTLVYADDSNVSLSDFRENSNSVLNNELVIPEGLSNAAKSVFSLGNSDLSTQKFMILTILLIGLILLIHEIVSFMPFFENNVLAWSVAVIFSLLISITGAINSAAEFLLNISDTIKLIQGWAFLDMLVALLLAGLLYYLIHILLRIVRNQMQVEQNKDAGFKAGTANLPRRP